MYPSSARDQRGKDAWGYDAVEIPGRAKDSRVTEFYDGYGGDSADVLYSTYVAYCIN